jgi:hypothetical protein
MADIHEAFLALEHALIPWRFCESMRGGLKIALSAFQVVRIPLTRRHPQPTMVTL